MGQNYVSSLMEPKCATVFIFQKLFHKLPKFLHSLKVYYYIHKSPTSTLNVSKKNPFSSFHYTGEKSTIQQSAAETTRTSNSKWMSKSGRHS